MFNWFKKKNDHKNSEVVLADDPSEPKLNLIFHFHCVQHEKICYAINKIKEHISLFNGYKIFTLSCPDNKFLNNQIFNQIIKDFSSHGVYFIPVDNDKKNRETLHFFDKACPLLAHLLKINNANNSYTFYGHSKGCTHTEKDYAITAWVNTLYKYNLDLFYDIIKPALKTNQYKFIGCLKTTTGCALGAKFHYAGTFFWFNSNIIYDPIFLTSGRDHFLGLEMWPNMVAADDECHSVFDLTIDNPYKYDFWYNLVYNRVIDKPSTTPCKKVINKL